MADLAGAMEAIEARLVENWTATPIGFENEEAPAVTDPVTFDPLPWLFCEIVNDTADIEGFGLPDNNVIRETGAIEISVMVPRNSQRSLARTYAVAVGEIFRTAKFYDSDPAAYVRTWTPTVGHGLPMSTENPSGNWWCVPVRIPFEFYHRA